MADALAFDADVSRHLLRTYLTDDVVEQRTAVRAALALRPGEDVLDIGCGPGLLVAEMAADVGPSGSVTGLDPSEQMLTLAADQEMPDGVPVIFTPGGATELPFGDAAFDAITSTQVYEYVAEIDVALAEARRVLRPGGRLLVLDTDWDSIVWRSSDEDRMRRVLAAWDEHLVHPYLPRRLPQLLREADFRMRSARVVPMLNVGYREDSYSGGLIGFVTGFLHGRDTVAADQIEAWADDLRSLGDNYFCSVNRYLFVADVT